MTKKFMNMPVKILVKRDELTLEGIKQVIQPSRGPSTVMFHCLRSFWCHSGVNWWGGADAQPNEDTEGFVFDPDGNAWRHETPGMAMFTSECVCRLCRRFAVSAVTMIGPTTGHAFFLSSLGMFKLHPVFVRCYVSASSPIIHGATRLVALDRTLLSWEWAVL